MTCLEVRERLTEHALGLLTRVDAAEVERHLEWCAGCRKESAELEEGAARMALAIPVAPPSPSLEERVVERIQAASGRIAPGGRRRIRVLLASTLAAALVAVGAMGWAIAERSHVQGLQQKVLASEARLKRLAKALDTFRGQAGRTFTADLTPVPGGQGVGSVVIFSAGGVPDQVVVGVILPSTAEGPFVVQLVDNRSAIKVGRLKKNVEGDWFLWEEDRHDLSRVVSVTVLGNGSQTVLTGMVKPYSPDPAIAG